MKPLIASVSALLVFGGLLVSASAVSARPAAEDFYSYKVDQATVEQVTDGDTRESFAVQIREAGVFRVEMVDPGGVKWRTSGHGDWYEPEYAYVKVTDTRESFSASVWPAPKYVLVVTDPGSPGSAAVPATGYWAQNGPPNTPPQWIETSPGSAAVPPTPALYGYVEAYGFVS